MTDLPRLVLPPPLSLRERGSQAEDAAAQNKPGLRLVPTQLESYSVTLSTSAPPSSSTKDQAADEAYIEEGRMTIENGYQEQTLVYRRFNNKGLNSRKSNQEPHCASLFIAPSEKVELIMNPSLKDHKDSRLLLSPIDSETITFDSRFPSGNLFCAYQVTKNSTQPDRVLSFDLVLQNDLNTSSFTQWYNFKISSSGFQVPPIIRLNIVNLYKGKSLYSQGMKPVAKLSSRKSWTRLGTDIKYVKNMLSIRPNGLGSAATTESSKFYSTLSFELTLPKGTQELQIAHAVPYTYSIDLAALLDYLGKQPMKHARFSLSTIGNTALARQIHIVCLTATSNSSKQNKQAIVFMARQHPGQTPGSHVCHHLLLQLCRSTVETEFLMFRYDVYIIPMINPDGVQLGNYRGNAYGFDLNRCWETDGSPKLPQIAYVKNALKKIHKKTPIQLIIDLHGHSRKKGTFFYGNTFGLHNMLLPIVAASTSTYVRIEDCTFTNETKSKSKTARAVLGHLFRETGSVYTYEISFHGGFKKTRLIQFQDADYSDIATGLLTSVYKTYMEVYREEKTLKESVFLKEVRKDAQSHQQDERDGSDSEAAQIVYQQQDLSLPSQQPSSSKKDKKIPSQHLMPISPRRRRQLSLQTDSVLNNLPIPPSSPALQAALEQARITPLARGLQQREARISIVSLEAQGPMYTPQQLLLEQYRIPNLMLCAKPIVPQLMPVSSQRESSQPVRIGNHQSPASRPRREKSEIQSLRFRLPGHANRHSVLSPISPKESFHIPSMERISLSTLEPTISTLDPQIGKAGAAKSSQRIKTKQSRWLQADNDRSSQFQTLSKLHNSKVKNQNMSLQQINREQQTENQSNPILYNDSLNTIPAIRGTNPISVTKEKAIRQIESQLVGKRSELIESPFDFDSAPLPSKTRWQDAAASQNEVN